MGSIGFVFSSKSGPCTARGLLQDRLHMTMVRTSEGAGAWPGERTRGVQPLKSMMLALRAAVVKVLLEALGVGYIGNVR